MEERECCKKNKKNKGMTLKKTQITKPPFWICNLKCACV